ncbi:MAG: methionine--tRNA ligase [Candidatus Saccharibacteria bacterium]
MEKTESDNFYVTTSIPYANGDPHLGHALEFIMADVLARSARQRGRNVIFSTGMDEHGEKVAEKAASLKLTPEQYVGKISDEFKSLQKILNISNDRFIRTTDKGHEQRAAIIWQKLSHDIYKGKYSGWYDVKQEEFVPEGQVDKARTDPSHPQAYKKLEENNYFFKLSKYTKPILDAIESGSFEIIPGSKKNEITSLLREGLQDISISRPKSKLEWGIMVPGDSSQVMYVWFEALMNYLTVLGYPENDDFKKFWPADVQVVGKDISRFHAAIWPAMLMSLELPLPKKLYIHSFVYIDGQAMSKSLGNGIHPKEIVDRYGVDAFRYFFLRHIPSYNDGDFSWDLMEAAYNNELANQLGNAVQRTASMVLKYQKGLIGEMPQADHDIGPYQEALENCQFDRAMDEIFQQIKGLNQYIDEEKPWILAKSNDGDHLREVLAYQAGSLVQIADLLEPFLPDAATKIRYVFKDGVIRPLKTMLFPRKELADKTKPQA